LKQPLAVGEEGNSFMEAIISLENINKSFPGVNALTDVNFAIFPNEIHAVMGENGAGKSTLMKIMAGMYAPDSGKMFYKGEEIVLKSSREAIEKGISIIHQELMSALDMTVAENIFLGREPVRSFGIVNHRELNRGAKALLDMIGLDINPKTKMRELSIAEMQLVEIAKAVSFKADVLIMDEPTSALTAGETKYLYKIMRDLKAEGVAIVFITHKLNEIYDVSDRITVFRDGRFICTKLPCEMNEEQLIQHMVGRPINSARRRSARNRNIGEKVLEVKSLCAEGVRDISFDLRKGEILGVAGLMGSGRTEMAEAVFGMRKATKGEIFVNGKKVRNKNPRAAIKNKIALITEDRKHSGLNLLGSVKDNIVLVNLKEYSPFFWELKSKENEACKKMTEALSIKTPSVNRVVNNLSGGNQQKTVIAKWLLKDCDIIIMDEPTKGIDVGAKEDVYEIIEELAAQGKSILMITSEMAEIINLSDRVIVFNNGRLTGELEGDDIAQETIMKYAAKKVEENLQ
jgi:ABC-type sugar transport system ATPase subunit